MEAILILIFAIASITSSDPLGDFIEKVTPQCVVVDLKSFNQGFNLDYAFECPSNKEQK